MRDGDPAKRAILIAGPTASGKSALALALAEEIGGTVINADSMQVYADLRILTARPSDADLARVPHRLFGHVDAAEAYSVGRWLADLQGVLDEVRNAGRRPILVGGTGLYISALLMGLSAIPDIPRELRARLRAEAATLPPDVLHRRLREVDPTMADRLRPTDPQRILRALEVYEASGRSLSAWQQTRGPPLVHDSEAVFLDVPRADLNHRIDRRFDAMMEGGMKAEVRSLAARGLSTDLPAMRALGVAPLVAALEDRMSVAAAVALAKSDTRRYAKRQVTFARHQWPSMSWKTADEAFAWLLAVSTEKKGRRQ